MYPRKLIIQPQQANPKFVHFMGYTKGFFVQHITGLVKQSLDEISW